MSLSQFYGRRLSYRVFMFLILMGVGAIAALGFLLLTMIRTVEGIDAERIDQLINNLLQAKLTAQSEMTATYSGKPDLYQAIVQRQGKTIDSLLAGRVAKGELVDHVEVFTSQGGSLYAYSRDRQGVSVGRQKQELAQLVPTLQRTTSSSQAVIGGVMHLSAGLAFVTAARILPPNAQGRTRETAIVLTTARYLDEEALQWIAQNLNLAEVQISPLDNRFHDGGSQIAHSVALHDPAGRVVAGLDWQGQLSGRELLRRTLPALGGLSLILALCSLAIGYTSAVQTRAFIREHVRAREDALTGLANRMGWNEIVGSESAAQEIAAGRVACLYFDMDKFKALNDTHGHDIGDVALKKLAEILRGSVSSESVVARLGGDEFVVLIVDDEPAAEAQEIALRIETQLEKPIKLAKGVVQRLEVSIGIVESKYGDNWHQLLARADAAMYTAKRTRKETQKQPNSALTALTG